MKKRIAVVNHVNLNSGGAASYELYILQYFKDNLSDHFYIDFIQINSRFKFQPLVYAEQILLLFWIEFKKMSFTNTFLEKIGLEITSFERQLIENKCDYVYFISPDIRVMTITKLKIISTIWDFGHLDLNKDKEFRNSLTQIKRKYYYNKSINNSEVVIVESSTTKNTIMKLYDKKASDILILSFSTIMMNYRKVFDDFIPKAKQQSSYFVYPANYWPHKNHLAIIKMVKYLKNKDIKIYFVGSKTKYISSFQEKISQFDCSDVIMELGRLEQKSLLSLIANSSGVLMPSKLGPTNLPVFESLFLGVPVIVSLAHERIKETEKVIRYIDVNDPEKFAFEIDMLPSVGFDRTDLLVEFEKNSKIETINLIRRINM